MLGNSSVGIQIASANNTVGGTTIDTRNVISANADGITLTGAGATGNVVQGSYIGTDITGTVDLGNRMTECSSLAAQTATRLAEPQMAPAT